MGTFFGFKKITVSESLSEEQVTRSLIFASEVTSI